MVKKQSTDSGAKSKPKRGEYLTLLQKRFCEEYLIDGNATAAYKRAGYRASNDTVASANSLKLLGDHRISSQVEKLQQERAQRCQFTADDVMREWEALATSDITELYDFERVHPPPTEENPHPRPYVMLHLKMLNELPVNVRRAIAGISVKSGRYGMEVNVKMHPKMPVLQSLGIKTGLLADSNVAFEIFKRYSYQVNQIPGGYEFIDTQSEEGRSRLQSDEGA